MRKLAIHIGCSTFEADAYRGRPPGALPAAELDAHAMADLTNREGFNVAVLEGPTATRGAVAAAPRGASGVMVKGDLLVLTFSGHGMEHSDAKLTDPARRSVGADNITPLDEDGPYDQSWCLRDGVLIDDRLYTYLLEFEAGVRIFVIS